MDTKKLIIEAHQNAVDHGFYNGCNGTKKHIDIGELLMLIVTEIAEAVEAHREGRVFSTIKNNVAVIGPEYYADCQWSGYDKYCFLEDIKDTFEDEIADIFIRLFDLCGYLGIELKILSDDESGPNANIKTIAGKLYSILKNLPSTYDVGRYFKIQLCNFYGDLLLFCTEHKINIEKHISAKMAYNKTRPMKHGKEY